MTETLSPPAAVQPPLFDLLARSHDPGSPARQICFDLAGKSCAFALEDGRIALLSLADSDGPMQRMRREADSGRALIRPREKPGAPLIFAEALSDGPALFCTSTQNGYLLVRDEGRLHRVTPRGQVVSVLKLALPILALAPGPGDHIALALPDRVIEISETSTAVLREIRCEAPLRALAYLPGSPVLVARIGEDLCLSEGGEFQAVARVGAGEGLALSRDGAFIAGGNGSGFWLWDRAGGRLAQLNRFPSPPQNLCFTQGEVFADGAFRLAGWSLASPPFDSPATGALRSGGQGLVLTQGLASHPSRPLIAAGRADGTLVLVQPGAADEMVLRHGGGAALSALAWSADGLHLALGCEDGSLALLALPPQLFR